MQNQSVSRLLRLAIPLAFACVFTTLNSSAWADDDRRGHGREDCSDRTLDGDYGFTIEGLLAIPGPGIQVRGVALQHYDGHGNLTNLDHVVIDGVPQSVGWRPASGTYSVNSDCTGTATINFPSPNPPLDLFFVVVKNGKEIRQVVNGNAIIATGVKVE
jgi:hypothetical protein